MALLTLVQRFAWVVLAVALLGAVACFRYVVSDLGINTDTGDMLSASARSP